MDESLGMRLASPRMAVRGVQDFKSCTSRAANGYGYMTSGCAGVYLCHALCPMADPGDRTGSRRSPVRFTQDALLEIAVGRPA